MSEEKRFTQEEVDEIIKSRLARAESPDKKLEQKIREQDSKIGILKKSIEVGLPADLVDIVKSVEDIDIISKALDASSSGGESKRKFKFIDKKETPEASFGQFIRGEG